MIKFFSYIENLWIGNDGKISLRRILAISFSIDLIITFHKFSNGTYKIIETLYSGKNLDAQTVNAVSSFLASAAMHIGIEAGLIAGLLSLTTYQSLQSKQPYDSSSYQNVDQESVPKVPSESTGS